MEESAGAGLLIIFAGLPATGKTTIARRLADELDAVYLRIDSLEQAIRAVVSAPLNDIGYRAAYAVAEDNLRLGRTVVADSVNPLAVTRDAWLKAAKRARAAAVEIEVKCCDADEHRRRVERRIADVPGLRLPTWDEVVRREYDAWDRDRVVIDTASCSVEETVAAIRAALSRHI